tara:strand:+ start:95 stop:835 length:741 start_codon:yes stop_codon:yes gene_type:complete
MALTKVSTGGIEDGSILNADLHSAANIAGSKLADNSISLAKLLHGDSNNNGKFLRANNGADPTFETIDLTALSASNLTSGTIPDARFPAALPAVDGSALTGLAAFPSGTTMLFNQTNAPTGWTKSTAHNNKALRVVSGNASSGGGNGFTTALNSSFSTSGGNVNNHTLTTSQMPSHSHGMQQRSAGLGCGSNIAQAGIPGTFGCNNNSTAFNTFTEGGGYAHNHTFSNPSLNLNVAYIDVIVASKD